MYFFSYFCHIFEKNHSLSVLYNIVVKVCAFFHFCDILEKNRPVFYVSNAGRQERSRYRMPAKRYQEGDSTGLVHVGFKAPKERESTRDVEAWEPDVLLSVRGKRLNAYEKRSCASILAACSWKPRSRYVW